MRGHLLCKSGSQAVLLAVCHSSRQPTLPNLVLFYIYPSLCFLLHFLLLQWHTVSCVTGTERSICYERNIEKSSILKLCVVKNCSAAI